MALQRLQSEGVLSAIVTTDMHRDVIAQLEQMNAQWNVPLHVFSKASFKAALKQLLTELQPDAAFVMTFPWKIPADILSIPRMGFFNFHHGMLPEMRGADPIFESIRRRMPEVGTCVHIMEERWDAGPVVLQERFPLSPEFTHGMLTGRMVHISDQMCVKMISMVRSGHALNAAPQDEQQAHYWPKAGAADLEVKWDGMDSAEIKALVKACNPLLKGVPIRINGWQIGLCDVTEVNLQGDASHLRPGTILTMDPQNGMLVYCKDGRALKLEVIYSEEGTIPGHKLSFYGIQPGMMLN